MRAVVKRLFLRCLLSACYVFSYVLLLPLLDSGEQGWLTGPLPVLVECSGLLFLIAAVLALRALRWAGLVGLAASVLCSPWWLYAISPNLYKPIFRVYRSVDPHAGWLKSPLPQGFSYSPQLWVRVLFFLLVAVLSFRTFKTAVPNKAAA